MPYVTDPLAGQTAPAKPKHRIALAIFMGITAFTAIVVGVLQLPDHRTATATMLVTQAGCVSTPDVANAYHCSVDVRYTAWGKVYSAVGVAVDSPTRLAPGDEIDLRYDPDDPADVTQETHPRTAGVALIVAGLVVSSANLLMAIRKCLRGVACGAPPAPV
jgi:hypothetical protein